jgi:predicted nucleic acid-binding Zn ribbon protein
MDASIISITEFHQENFVELRKVFIRFPQRGIRRNSFITSGACYNLAISMTRAGEILGKVVRKMERPEAAQAWLIGSWATIVGKTLAAHTRPIRCEKGSLEIAADGKGWRKQLECMKSEFCARINQAWGGTLVREIKFVSKPGPKRVPRELDNEHTPFVRKRHG